MKIVSNEMIVSADRDGEHQDQGMIQAQPEEIHHLTASDIQTLASVNMTQHPYPRTHSVPELIAAQARATPHALALTANGQSLSYSELDRKANQLAYYLRKLGVRPNVLVGLCVERSLDMVIGLLGILKASGAYVPIDSSYPPERQAFMVEDAQIAILITKQHLVLNTSASQVVLLDQLAPVLETQPVTEPTPMATIHDLAYVIYTSGSTGQPKGVQITHDNLLNLVFWHQRVFHITSADRVTQLSSPAFDATGWELWPYLTIGASVHLADEQIRILPVQLRDWLIATRITVTFLPTPLAERMLALEWPQETPLRLLLTGADVLHHYPSATLPFQLVNNYGPTEATVVATFAYISPKNTGTELPPIGRPVDNAHVYILDEHLRQVPVGVIGELYIGGAGLAKGYLHRPELTAERFIAHPFSNESGARLYKTGDLARFLPDGQIAFLGRTDHQVKIRGYRIELDEIASVLNEHPAVRTSLVLARTNGSDEKILVAYVVLQAGEAMSAGALRETLLKRLPGYMIPAMFVRLDEFPTTPNGKVDRAALPMPNAENMLPNETFAALCTAVEKQVADITGPLLGLEPKQIGRDANIFHLGASSLLGTQIIVRINEVFGIALPQLILFEAPTIQLVARAIATAQNSAAPSPVLNEDKQRSTERQDRRPLLPGQQSMLLSEELYGGTIYHLQFSAEIRGTIDRAAVVKAINALVERYEALRTTFERYEGYYCRRILAPTWHPPLIEIVLPHCASSDFVAAVHAHLEGRSASLLKPLLAPPVAFVLSQPSGNEEHMVITLFIHHVLIDGWAMGVLWRDFARYYHSFHTLLPLPYEYVPTAEILLDTAAHTSERIRTLCQQRAAQLADVPRVITLPSDLTRPATINPSGKRLVFHLSEVAVQSCESLAKECGVTRNTILLAAWALVIARRSDGRDFLLGVPIAARRNELINTVALCSHLIPVRCTLQDEDDVYGFIQTISSNLATAIAAAEVPFEDLVLALGEGGDAQRNPLVQLVFAPHDELVPRELQVPELDITLHEGYCGGTPFDATLYVQRWGQRPQLALEYATSLLTPLEASELASSFDATLAHLGQAIRQPLVQVDTLSADQQRRLALLSHGTPIDTNHDLWQLIYEYALLRPDSMAVCASDASLTYAQLIEAATATAARLVAAGVRKGDTVVLALPRSGDELIAILSLLRLGATYVAFDMQEPDAMLSIMLKAVAPRAFFAAEHYFSRLQQLVSEGCQRVCIAYHNEGVALEAITPDPESIAYIAFTSGSTGVPKGVRVPQRAIIRLVHHADFLRHGPGEHFLRLAPLPFDASTLEIFAPLVSGSTLFVYPDMPVAPNELAAFLNEQRITVLWLTAGLFRMMVDHAPNGFATVRQVLTGGDVVPPEQVRRLLTHYRDLCVTNGYGPTENTVFTTVYTVNDACEVEDPFPIGMPVPGTDLAILDEHGQLLPPGSIGELYAAGKGLAIDYLGLPDETQAAFGRRHPVTGERLYRTGDLVRWDNRGRLRFLGRKDQQVKIRGFRVELDAIQQSLKDHTAVRDAIVVVTRDAVSPRLIAGIIADAVPNLLPQLQQHLARLYPPYAIPSLWALVDAFPLTRNGKVDTRQLEQLALNCQENSTVQTKTKSDYEQAEQHFEATIHAIWQEVLERNNVGYDDHFFDVGGDSLRLALVHARLQHAMPHTPVSMLNLFQYPTIRVLADYLRNTSGGQGHTLLSLRQGTRSIRRRTE